MRALETYNKERLKKLGVLVGICMKNMWYCYLAMNTCWLLLVMIAGDFNWNMMMQWTAHIAVTGIFCGIYQMVVVKKSREVPYLAAYAILNIFTIVLLCHPSGLIILDGLAFGVIATYPVWTDQHWVRVQTALFVCMFIVRHVALFFVGYSIPKYEILMEVFGMLCIGVMLVHDVNYVHNQTMLLGDATRMDAATGLYNHEYFYEELEKRMRTYEDTRKGEREDANFCLLIADIDNFKRVNDTYGHAFGDEVLLGLAEIFKSYCGDRDFVARYGGEEFVMIMGGCHKPDAVTRANTIRRKFADKVFKDALGAEHQFTISLGVAEYDRPWETASKFFEQADQALYQAKNTGKNRVCSS